MRKDEFNRLLDSIRRDSGDEHMNGAARRVRASLEAESGEAAVVDRVNSCADFRALFSSYRNRTLSEARRMLVEDHLHSCVACRRTYQGPATSAARPARRRTRAISWTIAAATAVAVAIAVAPMLDRFTAGSGPRARVVSVEGELYRVADGLPLAAGAAVGEGEEIRTAKTSRAVLRLRDGSSVEMDQRSELRIAERFSGKTVRLDHGAVMVEAARQRRGRLQIATADCLVSVKGTIFEVTAGTKGSRVSVVEGEVKVDRDGASDLLHRGDQKTTSTTMQTTSVAGDVAWSRNAAKYVAMLGALSAIQKRIEQIPGPAPRYKSKLAGLLPENTIVFASIPNVGSTLSDAMSIFEEGVARNPALREWWKQQDSRRLREMVDQARAFSDYLGDEIVLAIPAGAREPLLIAEARRPGLRAYLEEKGVAVVENPRADLSRRGPIVMVHGNVVALGMRAATLARVAQIADAGGSGRFLQTPFWSYLSRRYESGAEWIFSADMEQILDRNVASTRGLDNVQYLTIERKPNLGRTENSAMLSFTGARRGIASWLGDPSAMGSLDFVSPQASFAASFVIKNPATLLAEAMPRKKFTEVAANLGGEMTVAVDGPLLPAPGWKAAIEVQNPARLESAIEQAATAEGFETGHEQSNGKTFYTLTSSRFPYVVNYVFTDGYLLIAPSRALLAAAMETRASGNTLPRSAEFRAQLPRDGHANFSALLYYNAGVQLGPIADQLKSSGLMTPEQQKTLAALAADREPGLIYAYGEPDRIFVASRSGFFGLGLDTLLGLNANGAAAFPRLFPPIFSNYGSRH